jgi:hypothetical protein
MDRENKPNTKDNLPRRTTTTTTFKPPATGRKLPKLLYPLFLNLLSFFLLAIVIIAVQTTYYAENYSDDGRSLNALLKLDVSTTLTVLRASQGLLSTITTLNLRDTFVNTHWVLMSRDDGISYPSLLALSPTTSAAGLIRLLTLPLTKTAWKPHFWT